MNYIIHDKNTSYQIKENEDLLELKTIIKDHKVDVLECCDFWDIHRNARLCGQRGLTVATGATRFCDPTGSNGSYNTSDNDYEKSFRPHLDPKMTVVHITFTAPSYIAKEFPNHQLELTKNKHGEVYSPWMIRDNQERVSYTLGIYKKTGFDELYKSMLVFKPNLTEEDFSKRYHQLDTDLVDIKPYEGETNCIGTIKKTVSINTDKSTVTLKLLLIDLKNNLPYIKRLL